MVWIDSQQLAELKTPQIVVVGAGAVGIFLAVDLARAGKRVLLLEAGQSDSLADRSVFSEVESAGLPFSGLHNGRFRALGGTTTRWGGQLVPVEPIAFTTRDWLGEDGWPIASDDLTEAHETTLDLLGMQRRLPEEEVWRRIRVDPPVTGEDLDFFLTRWLPEPNFARLFASDLASNPNLAVVTGETVNGLTMDAESGRVGVSIAQEGKMVRLEADQVVLANGTIEIARLLLQPLVGGGTSAWAANRWVGKGFVDHVDCYAGSVEPLNQKRFHQVFDAAVVNGLKYLPKLKLSEGCQRRQQLLGVAAHFVSSSEKARQLATLKTIARNLMNRTSVDHEGFDPRRSAELLDIVTRTTSRYLLHRRIYNPAEGGIQLRLTGEQIVVPESGLQLTEDSDGSGMRRAVLNWKVDGRELKTLSIFAQKMSAYLETAGLAKVGLDPLLVARDPAFIEKLEDGYHHMGMARMGFTRDDGVVDRNLKVFGTENLFIAGAAAFRSPGFANPTLTALALTMRLSQAIKSGSVG